MDEGTERSRKEGNCNGEAVGSGGSGLKESSSPVREYLTPHGWVATIVGSLSGPSDG